MTKRASAHQRGYDARWRKYRIAFLSQHPLCADHLKRGMFVASRVVDHVVPHRGDPVLFWDAANHQALCKACHDSAKQREERSGRLPGADVTGVPIDGLHPWRVGSRISED